jgi:glutamate formiminotransferase
MKMDKFTPQFISVESVSISEKQTQFINDLKEELIRHQINCPVYMYESKVKKEDRIKFNLE